MSVVRTLRSTRAVVGMDTAYPTQSWDSGTVYFAAHRGPAATVMSAHGEIDAANARQLFDYAQHCAKGSRWLILDLTGLEFFGTAGFSALHQINVQCAKVGLPWAVVPSRTVSRLLRICDPDHVLPVAESAAALLTRDDAPRRLLQLVPEPR